MTTAADKMHVHLLGQEFVIACGDNSVEEIQQVAARVERALRALQENGKTISSTRLALMAALVIAEEEHRAQKALQSMEHRMDDILRRLQAPVLDA